MAEIAVVASRNKAASGEAGEWVSMTINRNLKAGSQFEGMGHHMTVERIVEKFPDYSVALVSVGEAVGNAPPLRFSGEFDSSTRTADNAFRGGMRA